METITVEDITGALEKKAKQTSSKANSQKSGENTEAGKSAADSSGGFGESMFTTIGKEPSASDQDPTSSQNTAGKADAHTDVEPTAKNRNAARLVALLADALISGLLQFYAGALTRDPFKADQSDLENIQDALSTWMDENQLSMGSGYMLAFWILVGYSPKAILAQQMRSKDSTRKRKPYTVTPSESDPEEEAEEYDAEEVSQVEEVDLDTKLEQWNQEAQLNGVPIVARIDRAPAGICKVHWMFNNETHSATHGEFRDHAAKATWANNFRLYKKVGMDPDWLKQL